VTLATTLTDAELSSIGVRVLLAVGAVPAGLLGELRGWCSGGAERA
jgi:hypothetical protein